MTTQTLDREALRARVLELHDAGLTDKRIATLLGLSSLTTAWRLRNPESYAASVRRTNAKRAAAKRAWEDANDRGSCACGATLSVGARRKGTRSCKDCQLDMDKLGRAMRRERIREMWLAGASLREIAAAGLAANQSSASVEITGMRRDGWDMPYRRQPGPPS